MKSTHWNLSLHLYHVAIIRQIVECFPRNTVCLIGAVMVVQNQKTWINKSLKIKTGVLVFVKGLLKDVSFCGSGGLDMSF